MIQGILSVEVRRINLAKDLIKEGIGLRKFTWQIIALLLVLLFCVSPLTGCETSEEPVVDGDEEVDETEDEETGVDEDYTLVIGLAQTILTLDPANHRDRVTETVIRNIYDGLVTRTPDGVVVPEIAESWENPEPTIWEFKIRDGVKFHDGSDLTIEDVVFTFNRVIQEGAMEGETSPRKGLLGPVVEVEAVGDDTIRFILEEPWPILLAMLPHQQIVSKAYLEEVGSDIATSPMGTGPFKFVEGSIDERIVLERFEDYYGGSPEIPPVGPAPAARVIFEFMPEVSTRVAAIQGGDVHIIHNVPPDMVSTLEADPNVVVKTVDGTRMHMFEMNCDMAPFDDVRVRQAINYAIDMDAIVDNVLLGYGTTVAGPLLPHGFAVHPDLQPYGYDPEKAKELLTEAGYGDGFELVIDTEDVLKDVAYAAASMLQDIGIEASVRIWDWGVLRDQLIEGERMMCFGNWGNSTLDPSDLLVPKLRSNDRGNYSQYANPELDALLDAAEIAVDRDEREELYHQAQEIIYNDAPWVFGYVGLEIEACRANVVNWEPSTDSRINLHDVALE
ncbi:MAG TPA: ABC transporter substrate-binding protein [Firmicutes bacterium]|nr:ABC transporter substrate-binding protein [Bacillota bacterium]